VVELLGQPFAERRVHPLRPLAGAGQAGGRGDRGLVLGIGPSQLQSPPAQQVGDDLVDTVLGLAVHSGGRTFAAARNARSCMTLMAPTVEFISAATSFNEYPCRKRSSSTRR
jgi:hypothetical protein